MRKVLNMVLGGLQQKIFNLVLMTLLLTVAAYTVVIYYQANHLAELTGGINERQEQSIQEISTATMEAVIDSGLSESTQMKAYIVNDVFLDLTGEVDMLADYAQKLYSDPGAFPSMEPDAPDRRNDGAVSVQLLSEEGVDPADPEVSSSAALIGNMGDMMSSLFNSASIDACFIGTEDGLFLITDSRAGEKFTETGALRSYPVRDRFWYTGAKEAGKVYFTDVELDAFSGKKGIVCAKPVYRNGELAAVVGIDFFLDTLEEAVKSSGDERSGFTCIINQEGHVIFAPDTQELFVPNTSADAQDLRKSEEKELAAFVSDAMTGMTEVRTVHVGDSDYYMVGAPMETTGWAVISTVSVEATREPTAAMQIQYAQISDQAVEDIQSSIRRAMHMIMILVLLIFILGSAAALSLAKRIVGPLNTITKRIAALSGSNLQFMMEDEYRTGDEVEVLAEAFAKLSAKTVRYVEEVKRVTAEKERIGADLRMATAIQESQLPHLFPAFPDRSEFDIYAAMSPAREVGGDFYDFFLVDDNHICLVIADVSGKGVPAALFMMISRILIRNQIQNGSSPAQTLANVNNQLLEGNELGLFVTVWLAVIDLRTGEGVAANAGHEHPALCRAGGRYELIKYRHSPAVSTFEGIRYREHSFRLEPGDTVFVYTDGVPEATDENKNLFGEERMLEALNRSPEAAPENILRNVMRGINGFVSGAEQFDDITMLCLKYYGPAKDDRKDLT